MAESPTRTIRAARRRYEPGVELGHGATATVWRARDTKTGRDVALKRFHPHLLADPVTRARIREEAAAATRVSHPNIVAAVDTIEDSDGLALVFPYVEGTTLAQRLAHEPPLTPRQAARIALDISDALAAAHDRGVIHRDVKPANILLGADGRARLLDFGISRGVDARGANEQLTGAGMAIGTLPYMAPEQLTADPLRPATDIYGLGVVMYEMLCGRRPYAAANPVTLAQEQAKPPARIANVPEPLADLAITAMAPVASARPDAAQLGRGLRGWLDGRQSTAAATVTVVAPPRRARPIAAWVAFALALTVLGAALPFMAAGIVNGPSAAPSAASQDVAVAVPPTPVPAEISQPTPPPVISASQPTQESTPTDTHQSNQGGKHHHKRHHHKHPHGHRH
ncbi:MAG TPA: protein kinase [Candidatus Limnocylindria bacterium]|nr:protein kinase [Candidatus Limnocylindria bacterium]